LVFFLTPIDAVLPLLPWRAPPSHSNLLSSTKAAPLPLPFARHHVTLIHVSTAVFSASPLSLSEPDSVPIDLLGDVFGPSFALRPAMTFFFSLPSCRAALIDRVAFLSFAILVTQHAKMWTSSFLCNSLSSRFRVVDRYFLSLFSGQRWRLLTKRWLRSDAEAAGLSLLAIGRANHLKREDDLFQTVIFRPPLCFFLHMFSSELL